MALPTKNCTCEMVAPDEAVAVAERFTAEPKLRTVPGAGAVRDTVGPATAATLTVTAGDVTMAPLESTTRAVKATVPAAVGV